MCKTAETIADDSAGPIEVWLRPANIVAVMLGALGLLLCASVASLLIYGVGERVPSGILWQFGFGSEGSIQAWYSSAAWGFAAALFAAVALRARGRGEPYAWHWAGLALLFLLFSLDETAQIHEGISDNLQRALDSGGVAYFAWVLPAAVGLVALGGIYLRFALHLPARLRISLAFGVFFVVTGALLLEGIEGIVVDDQGGRGAGVAYHSLVVAQDVLELLGVTVIVRALLHHLSVGPGFRVRVRAATDLRNRAPTAR